MDHIEFIREKVHHEYYKYDTNCARTTMYCLSELLKIPIDKQVITAAVGMHGAGGYRAQCGLVEGALMFIGIYYDVIGKSENEAVKACYEYGEAFEEQVGSLRCRELRPGGFHKDDPPHMCEELTCKTIEFAYEFLKDRY